MPRNTSIKSVLIIGSGPIVIGQACEFDYSGTQAALSLKEEGIEVTILNSNPATIMTDKVTADSVYLLPLTTQSIVKILNEKKIDAVLPTMGGQTALNLCIKADEMGIWKKYGVQTIGVDIAAIEITENREKFRQLMIDLGVGVAPSETANSFLEGKEIAQRIGFPLVIRPSYTLGGSGAAFVHTREEFDELLKRGLHASPIHEVLIDKAVLGWKEYELELLRDNNDNVCIICSIENFDPMGIHTGDSITVAPAQTLSDTTYQKMRTMAIMMMRSIGNFAGGCNVQFAVSPDENEDIIAIEINPRVSRSSALASKATGYPIARIAAKLAIGYNLDELVNPITGNTSAYFEPTLDYVIVKIPRWNFDKFKGTDRKLGLQMKSVGEVMAIGRTFQEALQKACQSLEVKRNGLGADGRELRNQEEILKSLANPSWNRLFHIYDAFKLGIPMKTIQKLTLIDKWFLNQIEELVHLEKEIEKFTVQSIPHSLLFRAKQKGYADRQIAHLLRCLESEVYKRRNELGIKRIYKMVDTCAAEFKAQTPYFYSTFEAPPQPSPKGRESEQSYTWQTASPSTWEELKERSKKLRDNPTEAEALLWKFLSSKQLGNKFRRQHVIGNNIVDFVNLDKKLVIEIDGKVHETQKEYDEARTQELASLGFKVIRFTNSEVLSQPENVSEKIKKELLSLLNEGTINDAYQSPPLGEDLGGAKKVIVLGSGPNRIGQGIEFDYSCVHGILAAKEMGFETIMINCNPETVSTDFRTADRLYFEPVFWEHIYDIILNENPFGVIVQLGGQTALKLAEKLNRYGINILGTSYQALDLAEDRWSFSTLLKENNIPYPKFGVIKDAEQAVELSRELGFPLLVRPSYVLGGQGMKIVINEQELETHVVNMLNDYPEASVLLDHFLERAIEAEADALCDGENVYIIGMMEHIEPAGIHSGDSYAVLPPFDLSESVMQQLEQHTKTLAKALNTVGLINIQFAVKNEVVYVIEANPRASRTVPFIAKAYDEPYVNYATKLMLGTHKISDFTFNPRKRGYAIKIPVFSYEKFPDINKELGPEMKSTGEAIYFIDDLTDEYFHQVYSERNLYLSK
jgi:carbamoylphosphate synthase large subunit/very-short-patch-repair endonuclease